MFRLFRSGDTRSRSFLRCVLPWFGFPLLRPPGCRLLSRGYCRIGHVAHGQWALLDADMLELIDRSACLVEPVSVVESCAPPPVLVLSPAASTSSAASGRCSRMSFPRGLRAHSELLLSLHCDSCSWMIGTFLCSVTLQRDVSPCSLMYFCMYSILGHILRVSTPSQPSVLIQSVCAL